MTQVKFRSDMDVELVQAVADDLTVIRSARVSTLGERSLEVEATTVSLIRFLMKNRHGTPFEHNSMTFYVRAPIFVWREFMRRRMFSYNEESGRYKQLAPEFYVPAEDRPLVQVGKPGEYRFEPGSPDMRESAVFAMRDSYEYAYEAYLSMLQANVAREVARMVLPVATYSSAYVTGNARALMNFLSVRVRSDVATFPSFPQREIEMVAKKMESIWATLMPVTHDEFVANGRVCP